MQSALAESWASAGPNVMEITGRLDSGTAPQVEEDVLLCIQSGAQQMVLDCAALSSMTGAGLRAVLAIARAMQKTGGKLAVCNLQPQVEAMFKTSGCNAFIPVFDSQSEAISAFAG